MLYDCCQLEQFRPIGKLKFLMVTEIEFELHKRCHLEELVAKGGKF